jgi:hypothetical protein
MGSPWDGVFLVLASTSTIHSQSELLALMWCMLCLGRAAQNYAFVGCRQPRPLQMRPPQPRRRITKDPLFLHYCCLFVIATHSCSGSPQASVSIINVLARHVRDPSTPMSHSLFFSIRDLRKGPKVPKPNSYGFSHRFFGLDLCPTMRYQRCLASTFPPLSSWSVNSIGLEIQTV